MQKRKPDEDIELMQADDDVVRLKRDYVYSSTAIEQKGKENANCKRPKK